MSNVTQRADKTSVATLFVSDGGDETALANFTRLLANIPGAPPVRFVSKSNRAKVKWTPEMIARFKREAMRCADNRELARRLGLPEYCEGSMRMAKSRYFRDATVKPPSRPTGRPRRTLSLAMAA